MKPGEEWKALRELAEHGSRCGDPLPANLVRQLGTRRRQTRRALFGGVAVLAVVVGGGAGVIATQDVPARPAPMASQAQATQDSALTRANVPRRADFSSNGGRYTDPEVTEGDRSDVSSCQQAPFSVLGAVTIFIASSSFDYAADGSAPDPDAQEIPRTVAVMDFGSRQQAEAAYATLRRWGTGCDHRLESRDDIVNAAGSTAEVSVAIEQGVAVATEWRYRSGDEPAGQETWETFGLALVGNRIAVATVVVVGQEQVAVLDERAATTEGLPVNAVVPLLKKTAGRLSE